ncbi:MULTISPECIES: excinuclease ABC subunit UvrA [Alistipes]|uniref:excinuclease ABC subunit UvrA n=1 Tax=Alistipes TaxID=239759 RepID=UPI001B382C24|nr:MULTISPECIES: excinuclease ABC subunit UvrA [Alistipes]MBQ4903501.1 excinuclease ABC subunit UvrA [Alistipes sp. Marseille-P2263]MCI2259257.1 excinuclease ABC subunit UvrA [Alistipes dispar]
MEDTIKIYGARVHNLKNVDLEIPRRKLVVITGLSGSGKSSLAFDTIYAEGQRRYMETLSTYARQFVGTMERPDVDKITGLSPVVAIEQKTTNKNPRSTVGTVTEINDFLRLLYARASRAYSPVTGEEMVHYTDERIAELILSGFAGRRIAVMAPVVKGRKGHYRELFETLARKGYIYARIDGEIREISAGMRLDRYKIHTIDLVVDRLVVSGESAERLMTSLREAMRQGKGTMAVYDYGTEQQRFYSRHLMCPSTGIAFEDPAPHTFSFNSPKGACPHCNGLGEEAVFDLEKIVPDPGLSLREGAVEPLGKYRNNLLFAMLEMLGRRYDFTLDDPVSSFSEEGLNAVLYGDSEPLTVDLSEFSSSGGRQFLQWEGVAEYIGRTEDEDSKRGQKWRDQFLIYRKCSVCGGSRLRKEALQFRIDGKNIAEVSAMSIADFSEWVAGIGERMTEKEWRIAQEVVKEIRERLRFLMDVGLGYLSLSRSSRSLSGGESQRIRLATQIGSKLVNVLYILDEPSIGLHQRDNRRLIRSLEELRDAGNSVIVVEHDEDMMRAADFIVDVGPRAGRRGGEIVAAGTFDDILKSGTVTADYLTGRRRIEIPAHLRPGTGGRIVLRGARGNNLKNVTVEFPLGKLVCVTGVSGSGKSTLVNETLRPILSKALYRSFDQPLEYDSVEGIEHIDKLVVVDQSPIGRSPRSNPATYSNVFSDIRKLFEMTPDAQIRGFKAGRFSFNVKGGRCEECRGAGVQTIEMNFLPDVYVRCKACGGHRYNRETLEVKYKGKNIDDVLNMTVNMAVEFFENIPAIHQKLRAIQEVGLGYLTLGQPCTTLSGGESQRIKLASELSKRDTGRTLYILDEPTTGLHFEDIRLLLEVLDKLVDRGNTVIVIEHNLDVIKVADHLIDMGPEGGAAGGRIVACGTPHEVARCPESHTGRFLEKLGL